MSSVQFSDMQMLPMVCASSRSLDACFSACSAGQPCTCLIRFSLKWAAREGVKEVRAAEAEGGAEAELGAWLLLEEEETWLGPGEGLL